MFTFGKHSYEFIQNIEQNWPTFEILYSNMLMTFCVLQGNVALEKSSHTKPYSWLPDAGWEDCVRVSEVLPDKFSNLLTDIEHNEDVFKQVSLLF